MIVVATDDNIQLSIVADSSKRKIGRADDGDALFMFRNWLSKQIEGVAISKDVGFRVHPSFGIDTNLQAFLLDQADEYVNGLLGNVGLVHQLNSRTYVLRCGRCHRLFVRFFSIVVFVQFLMYKLQPAVPFGHLLQRARVGCVSDQELQFLNVGT